MPVLNGIDTLKEIKKRFNKIKVIMLTVEDDRRTITEVIDIGADGYILKESAGSEIVNAIKAVSNNEKYMDVALLKIIFHDIKDNFRKEKSIIYTDKTSVIQQIIK
ncbi:Putative Two-component response regulator [Clostridium chauvoei JF4335]|nr:Putative Two-component response regulator [Clostridium chauvoei JF4335]